MNGNAVDHILAARGIPRQNRKDVEEILKQVDCDKINADLNDLAASCFQAEPNHPRYATWTSAQGSVMCEVAAAGLRAGK